MAIKKPIDTVSLVLEVVALVKTASLVLVMTLLEFARIREQKAKDGQAVAESELKVERKQNAIDKDVVGVDPRAIIDEQLRIQNGLQSK